MNALGIVKQIVEEAGMGISYVYEDLIFVEHNAYLLQFTEKEQEVMIHKNNEADETMLSLDIGRLQEVALDKGMRFLRGQNYTMDQDEEEQVRLEFSAAP